MTQEELKKKGFFETAAGVITGTTALIIAVSGLVAALNSAGCFRMKNAQDIIKPKPSNIVDSTTVYTSEISFFEADEDATPESRSGNKFIFSQNSRYIFANIKVIADVPPLQNTKITIHVKFYDSRGALKRDREPFTSLFSKGEYVNSFYSGFKQDWIQGKYAVVVYINEIEQPTAYFTIQ